MSIKKDKKKKKDRFINHYISKINRVLKYILNLQRHPFIFIYIYIYTIFIN
jgi:hypothetical protein